jgi:DNA-binding winged helix-turn-helix (wHTH) protein
MAFRFGEFSFDSGTGELARHGRPVPLQQQPARVLRYLLEHPDRVITREELVRHIWPDGHYVNFDQGLNYCIRQIRVALGEGADAPRFLETVPRRGYRWRGPSAPREPAPIRPWTPATAAPVWRTRRVTIWGAAAFTAIGIAMGASLAPRLAPTALQPPPAVTAERDATVRSHLRMAFDALHLLTHAAIEPERRAEAPRAIVTLWFVVASQLGLTFAESARPTGSV